MELTSCSSTGGRIVIASFLISALSSTAFAEEPVTEAPVSSRNRLIEEVVVTAQKREESIDEVPISISAFSGDQLEALGVSDTRDLSVLVPGFTSADSGYNTPIYTLRGVGFNDSTYTATSTVGVYVDEVSLPYSIMTKGASLDIERLEVLKGPQGTLYGRNTTGGAINYIANKPTAQFEAGIEVSYGRFETSEIEGFVSGPISQSLAGRLAVKDVRSQEGSQTSRTRPGDSIGKLDKQSFRGSLEWQASDTLFLRFVTEGWSDRSEPRAVQVVQVRQQFPLDPTGVAFLPPQARNYPVFPFEDADPDKADWDPGREWMLDDSFLLGALRTEWDIAEELQFVSILSHMRVESNGSSFPQSGFNFENAEQTIDAHIETTSLEFRLSGVSGRDNALDWMIGANLSKDRGYEYHREYLGNVSPFVPNPVTGRSTLATEIFTKGAPEVEQVAAFFQTAYALNSSVTLTAGARYTDQSQVYRDACSGETTDSQSAVPGVSAATTLFTSVSALAAAQYTLATGRPGTPVILQAASGECFTIGETGSNAATPIELNEDNISFRLALDWQPTDDALLYLSAGRGYKAGSFPVTNASRRAQYEPVTQEELLAFEIGAKLELLSGQLQTNTAIYHYDYRDKQLLTKTPDPIFGPLPILKNAPKSRVQGVEAEVKYSPDFLRGLFLAGTASYTDTEVLEFTSYDNGGVETDFAGRPFNFAPKLQYTLVANYGLAVLNDHYLTLGADYYYSDETNSSLEGDPFYAHPSYGLVGLRAALSDDAENWKVSLWSRNLLDEFYTVSIYQNGDGVSRVVGSSRRYGVSFEYNWL